ncbi:hypothetical protein [Paracoccus sp. SY]|uniref:hypothetical protein n=1 Tax=Paracoccus sp. SY TaxID=1330255 RepID=UPI000CD14EE8|nr:hypothetical protein [Paracoccus sp. SY]
MNIERILRDLNGTVVPMGGAIYHFQPLWADGPHVAPVENEDHQKVFLSIPEGYRRYDGPLSLGLSDAVPLAAASIATLEASKINVAQINPASLTIEQLEAELAARRASQADDTSSDDQEGAGDQTDDDGNDPDGDESEGAEGGEEQAAPTDDLAAFEGKELTDAEDAALRALFKSELGRAAPPKSKPETMIAQIRAKREAE